jgi:paraquat-inducible protein A
MNNLKACHCCGLVHRVPGLAAGERAVCVRCRCTIARCGTSSRNTAGRTAALALGAFVLYWPAILLPMLEVERLGHHHRSSLLAGSFEMLTQGNWFVGIVIVAFSLVIPLLKIVLLLELSLLDLLHRRHKAVTYRLMELAGKWSMLDVLLLALLVMLVKLDSLVQFELGPAVVAFVLCVAVSIGASWSFDPHSIWEGDT